MNKAGSAIVEGVGGLFLAAINAILYALLGFFSLFFSIAATIFAWCVDAAVWQQLFNMKSVYTLWGMVRDFFNLFFILTLIFIAFCTIFQIQAYNYKKWLLNLVLMALLVNFSFPVTRFIIDATNVPMYFFLDNSIGDGEGGIEIFEAFIGGSQMNTLLFPPVDKIVTVFGEWKTTGQLVRSIVFVVILATSLLILALLYLVRVIALLILVIFSPVGFAGSAIPWMQDFSKKWWSYLFKYALFGPAAALIILVGIRFLEEFSIDQSEVAATSSAASASIREKADGTVIEEADASMITSMVMIVIPVILIWTAITIGQTMGIVGGAKLSQLGQKFMKNTGKTMSGYNWSKRRYDAYKSERKKRADAKFAAGNIGQTMGKRANAGLDQVSAGRTKDSSWKRPWTKLDPRHETARAKQARLRYLNHDLEEVNNAAKENLLEEKSNEQLIQDHNNAFDRDDYKMIAATAAKMGERGLEVRDGALDKIRSKYGEVGGIESLVTKNVEKNLLASDPEKVLTKNGVFDESKFRDMIRKGEIDRDKIASHGWTQKVVQFMNEQKKLDSKFLNDLEKKNPAAAEQIGTNIAKEIGRMNAFTGPLSAEQQKERDRLHVAHVNRTGDFHTSASDADKIAVFKKADADVLKQMNSATLAGNATVIAEHMNPQQFGTAISKLAQEGTDVTDLIRNLQWQGAGPNADKIRTALSKDNRLNTL